MTIEKKKSVPRGIIAEVARKANVSATTAGASLGIYEKTDIGYTEETADTIKKVAMKVAKEKINELEAFIASIE